MQWQTKLARISAQPNGWAVELFLGGQSVATAFFDTYTLAHDFADLWQSGDIS